MEHFITCPAGLIGFHLRCSPLPEEGIFIFSFACAEDNVFDLAVRESGQERVPVAFTLAVDLPARRSPSLCGFPNVAAPATLCLLVYLGKRLVRVGGGHADDVGVAIPQLSAG